MCNFYKFTVIYLQFWFLRAAQSPLGRTRLFFNNDPFEFWISPKSEILVWIPNRFGRPNPTCPFSSHLLMYAVAENKKRCSCLKLKLKDANINEVQYDWRWWSRINFMEQQSLLQIMTREWARFWPKSFTLKWWRHSCLQIY